MPEAKTAPDIVKEALRSTGGPMKPSQVFHWCENAYGTCPVEAVTFREAMPRMVEAGELLKVGYGLYSLPTVGMGHEESAGAGSQPGRNGEGLRARSQNGDHIPEGFVRVNVVVASAGNGAEPERVGKLLVTEQQFVRDFAHRIPPSGEALDEWYVRVEGDSMAPEFFDGDYLPIEPCMKKLSEMRSNDLYVIYYKGHMHIRRIAFEASGRVHILCTNPRYPNEIIQLDDATDVRVLGKVRLRERDQLIGAFMAKIVQG